MRVSEAFMNALNADVVNVAFFVEMEFRTETVRLWTGPQSISFEGNTFLSTAGLGEISNAVESILPGARGIKLSIISSATAVYQAAASDSRNLKGRPLRVWFALMNDDFNSVEHSYLLNEYKMNTLIVQDVFASDGSGGTRISLEAEHELIDLFEGSASYYSNEDQKRLHPGDTYFQFITKMPDKDIRWFPGGRVNHYIFGGRVVPRPD